MRDAAEAYDVQDAEVDLGDGVLVDHGDPAGHGAAAETGEGVAVEGDDAGRGRGGPRGLEQGRFARAVGAEQSAVTGAWVAGDVHPVEDEPAAGRPADPLGARQGPWKRS
ncbi:hypothetical protein SMICM304S_09477 [Streptomyces microflavus]